MKILQINTYQYPKGGAYTHFYNTNQLFINNGHQISSFGMQHPLNKQSIDSKYFVSHIDFIKELNKKTRFMNLPKVLARTVYSLESKRKLSKLIVDKKPDIAMVHNFLHHLSPSIFTALKGYNIPVILTIHDYTILCPNTSFITWQGQICEACKQGKYYQAVLRKCKKNSLGASFLAALENTIHSWLKIYEKVDHFIAPSKFLYDKFIEYGFERTKISLINNFVFDQVQPTYKYSDYALFVGRIDRSKGLEILLEVYKDLPELKLKIVGTGPFLDQVETIVQTENLKNVEVLGFKTGQDLIQLFQQAKYIVVPSIWYENFPYVVLEAMLYGKPVIGSNIGGIPEQIDDGITGYLYVYNSIKDLKLAIMKMENSNIKKLGKNARNSVLYKFNENKYYKEISELLNKYVSA